MSQFVGNVIPEDGESTSAVSLEQCRSLRVEFNDRRRQVAGAIDRAISYLKSKRDRRGWWQDFDTLAGASDEWATAFVAAALAESRRERAVAAARESWALLRRRRWWSAGWGYNAAVPADADSTLWVLQLAHRLGVSYSMRIHRAHLFLSKHQRGDGGIATYADAGPIRHYTRLAIPAGISFRGWCGSHPCVTALAATLPRFNARDHALSFLRHIQLPDGSWPTYWGCDREYTTALAVEVLARSADSTDAGRVRRAVEWARARLISRSAGSSRGTSAFATACGVRVLLCARDFQEVAESLVAALSALLTRQQPDGSWPASAVLRIPPPNVTDPESYSGWVLDV